MSRKDVGGLAVSMLRGRSGYQRKEVDRLCRWLEEEVKPHLLLFTNVLIGGCIPTLRERLGVPILVTLQGDDIFLDALPEPYRGQAIEEIRKHVPQVDGFVVHASCTVITVPVLDAMCRRCPEPVPDRISIHRPLSPSPCV